MKSLRSSRIPVALAVCSLLAGCPESPLAPSDGGGEPAPGDVGGEPAPGDVGGEPVPVVCLPPAFVWRRPGGYWSPAAGHDADWSPRVVVDPEADADPESGFSCFTEALDACGRQKRWSFVTRCVGCDECEVRAQTNARYDDAGRLLELRHQSTTVPGDYESTLEIEHTYDASGARTGTRGSVLPDGGTFFDVGLYGEVIDEDGRHWDHGVGVFTYVNDERGRLVEEAADVAGEVVTDEPVDGVTDRRSRFTWNDDAGTVTEEIDLADDGVVDEIRIYPQPGPH